MAKISDYYKTLAPGKYLCPACGTIFTGAFARHDAKNCCPDKKPLSKLGFRQAEEILASSHHIPTPRKFPKHHHVKHKDHYGHRYRGKDNKLRYFTDYFAAQDKLDLQYKKNVCAWLNRLLPEWDPDKLINSRTSTLKRLSFCYINHNWEGVKAAAYDLAEELCQARMRYILRHSEMDEKGIENKNESNIP